MQILMGLIGMVALLAIAVLLSNNRKAINLRTVLGASDNPWVSAH